MTDVTPNNSEFEAQLALAKSFKVAAQHVADGVVQKHKEDFFVTSSDSFIDSEGSQLIREAAAILKTDHSQQIILKNSIELIARQLISEFSHTVMSVREAHNITKRYNRKIRDNLYMVSEASGLISPEVRNAKGLGYKPPTYS